MGRGPARVSSGPLHTAGPAADKGWATTGCSGERLGIKSPSAGHVPSFLCLVSPLSPGEPLLWDPRHKGHLEHWEGHALSLNSCPATPCPQGTPDPGPAARQRLVWGCGVWRGAAHTELIHPPERGPCSLQTGCRAGPAAVARVLPGQDQPRAFCSPAGSSRAG